MNRIRSVVVTATSEGARDQLLQRIAELRALVNAALADVEVIDVRVVVEPTPIRVGHQVRDTVSGYEGIATARVDYLSGCIQFGVTAPVREGKLPSPEYFDFQRLAIVGPGVVASERQAGGPADVIPGTH